jgi:RHS repeat-associated protein
VVDGQASTLTYDDAGRILEDGRRLYEWDPDGCLAVTRNVGALERYVYTADGRLAAVWTGNATTPSLTLLHDDLHPLTATSPSGPVWDAVWGPGLDRPVEWTDSAGGSGLQLALTDERGTVIGAWSPSAGLTGSLTTTPEGRVTTRGPDGTVLCTEAGTGGVCPLPGRLPFGFSGTWRSPTSGLVWLRTRWYDPQLGQFLSPDPAGAVDSANPYTFAGGDPVNGSDPFGLGSAGPAARPSTSGQSPRSPGGGGRGAGAPRPPWTFISSIVLATTPGTDFPAPSRMPPIPPPSFPSVPVRPAPVPPAVEPRPAPPVSQMPLPPEEEFGASYGSEFKTWDQFDANNNNYLFNLGMVYEFHKLLEREERARLDEKLRQLMPHDDRGPIRAPSRPGQSPLLDPRPQASQQTDPTSPTLGWIRAARTRSASPGSPAP